MELAAGLAGNAGGVEQDLVEPRILAATLGGDQLRSQLVNPGAGLRADPLDRVGCLARDDDAVRLGG